MSDEDREVDIETDEDDDDGSGAKGSQVYGQDRDNETNKRAHHNALERKRRDHIKDSFHSLRDSVPDLQGEKVSRAQILKRAAEYIQMMRDKNQESQKNIEKMKRSNKDLEHEISAVEQLENSSMTGRAPLPEDLPNGRVHQRTSSWSEEEEASLPRRKKHKSVSEDS